MRGFAEFIWNNSLEILVNNYKLKKINVSVIPFYLFPFSYFQEKELPVQIAFGNGINFCK